MITRKIEKQINDWIDNGKRAMLISGARQVGKTYIIRKCLREKHKNYLEINLIDNPNLIEVFGKSSSVRDLEINLSIATGYSFVKNESIIFIDEAQECKEIITKIKFWVDEGSYKYILSGSLLGVELNNLRSAPVGYLDEHKMYPLDFEEYLIANGVLSDSIEYLKEQFEQNNAVSDAIHAKMMEHFRRYLVVGGMPAAVAEFLDSGDLNKVSNIQKEIITFYKRDFTKYESENKRLMLQGIYDLIPSELLKQNRRFNYNDLEKGLRFEKAENSFIWLESAGVVISAYNATEPRISLNQNKKSSLVKMYLSDVGLLTYQYGSNAKLKLLMGDESLNCGGIYENVVAQELFAHEYKLFYYNSHKQGELDFVVEHDNSVLPIEVKSGKDYYVHSAINNVLSNKEYEIKKGIVFSNYNRTDSENKCIQYAPIYMCAFLSDKVILPILK